MGPNFLNPRTVAALGATQYSYSQEFTIGAATSLDGEPNTSGSGNISIQGGIHFITERLSIIYPTVRSGDDDDVDDGVCRLTLKLSSGRSSPMFNNPASVDLIAVPGRMPVSGITLGPVADAAAMGQPPHIPGFPFFYFLPEGSSFAHEFANRSDRAAVVKVFWSGWNVLPSKCATFEDLTRIMMECQEPPAVA